MNVPAFSNVSADLALAVYLEPHADRRRVLLLGEVEGALAAHLSRVAGHVEIIDPSAREAEAEPRRERGPTRGGRAPGSGRGPRSPYPSHQPDETDVPELPFDTESFDLVVVADEQALPEPRRAALHELRRVTARDGLLVVASGRSRQGEARGPQEEASPLARTLRAEFDHVRVFTQAPLLGYVLSDADSAREAELSIDSSLVRAQRERVERVIALASDARPQLEARLWVQVPPEPAQQRAAEVDPRLVESLRKAEDDARRALRRESDLLRELERERKARDAGEAAQERSRALERKLLAMEADYDDAVGRVRYLERLLLEREAESKSESEQEHRLEADLRAARAELGELRERLSGADAEREAARADAQAAAQEITDVERRLSELSAELNAARADVKRQETVARDLLEELRGLEQRALVAVEHDARVSELEAERERAMQRALEAEVARESAQMRVDELRAQLEPSGHAPSAAQIAELERKLAEAEAETSKLRGRRSDETSALYVLRGERNGLRLRLAETEQALLGVQADAQDDEGALDSRLALAEARAQAAIEALGAAEESLKTLRATADQQLALAGPGTRQLEELETQLARAERRIETLERELEEADRFAEDHAADSERVEALERELLEAREKLDELDDEVRAAQDELFAKRGELRAKDEQLEETRRALSSPTVHGDEHAQEQLRSSEAQLAEARDALAEARRALAERDGAEQELRERDQQLAEAREALAEARRALAEREESEQELRARDEQLSEARRTLAAHGYERERVEEQLRARDDQLADARQTIATHQQDRERVEEQLRAQDEQLGEARRTIALHEHERQRLEEDLRTADDQLADARRALAAHEQERDRVEEDLRDRDEQLRDKEDQLAEARRVLATHADERERVGEELRAKEEQLEQARRAIAALELEREQVEADLGARIASERERAEAEVGQRLEQLTQRERDLRAQVEDGHAALAEARAILSHLAVRVGADTHDLPAIMQALDQQSSPPMLDALRTALAEAQAARSDGEYQLSRMGRELEQKEARIRELEESLHAPPAPQHFEPPEV
jgi:chromosome segregation ATPase